VCNLEKSTTVTSAHNVELTKLTLIVHKLKKALASIDNQNSLNSWDFFIGQCWLPQLVTFKLLNEVSVN